MAWQMPTAGQWNPGIAQTPDMGTYTAEQWTAMQQQNWQQWSQWQQQYTQWQSQFGQKYAEQMQAYQAMGGLPTAPPLPATGVPPPAPPPPDQPPPPPPPHENNLPLYAQPKSQSQPAPVPPTTNNQQWNNSGAYSNNNITGNTNNNWSSVTQASEVAPSHVNSEALKNLAEEERLFDIQFKKWEEEIAKWKRDNVNHPDKKAYKEYEDRFEACRAQLMERRQQMKQKRTGLLTNTIQAPVSNNSVTTKQVSAADPQMKNNKNKPNSQQYGQAAQMYQDAQQYQYNDQQQYQQRQYNNKSSNKSIDPQDRYESYQGIEDYSDYSPNYENSNFLPTSISTKNIPGLDLVPEPEKMDTTNNDVVVIPDDVHEKMPPKPDYSIISKGINNILGDEKIMNILNMVQGKNNQNTSIQPPLLGTNDFSTPPPNTPWNRNNNQQIGARDVNHDNRQMGYDNRQNSYDNMQGSHQQQAPQNRYPQEHGGGYDGMSDNINRDQYYDNNQYSYSNAAPRPLMDIRAQPPNRPPLQNISGQQNMQEFRRDFQNRGMSNEMGTPVQPPRPKWVDEPMFTPTLVVEYEHKPLRLKARDFIEPVHTFDYNHISKDEEKKKDFEKEVDELFSRKPRRQREDNVDRYGRDEPYRDLERRLSRDESRDFRDEYRGRGPREEYDERRRPDERVEDRRRDERDNFTRRDHRLREYDGRERDYERFREMDDRYREHSDRYGDIRERDRERDSYRDRNRDRREDRWERSRSQERDFRKRGHSKDSDIDSTLTAKKPKESANKFATPPAHVIMIDDLLEPPGRDVRPAKIAIIIRGPPGSGKSYLAKLIRDKEAEYDQTVRILSIDDYFMQESEIEEKDPNTGKIVKKPSLKYEYDSAAEESYLNSLKRAFKRTITDGYFNFLIFDAINETLKSYADIWNFARQNGFQVYVCTMELDAAQCHRRNIHGRSLEDIEVLVTRFFPTPAHHIHLDPSTLLQSAAIPVVHMEDVQHDEHDQHEHEHEHDQAGAEPEPEPEVETSFTSKWEKMDDVAKLARLDGTNKPLRPSQLSMEDYLQLDDWTPNKATPGKKSVRWADIEERRQQEKMRAIGFVVGQTDWNRMTDPTMGSSALTQTKYIERVRRN